MYKHEIYELCGADEIIEDEFTGTTFGEVGQITVLGWCGRTKCFSKHHIIKCSICSQDRELYGDGIFRSNKTTLMKGIFPCGCAKSPLRKDWQVKILCKRKAESLGHKFIDFAEPFKGNHTKLTMSCIKHGLWESTSASGLLNYSYSCSGCRLENMGDKIRKPDEEMIASFFASGAFDTDTKFKRSGRLSPKGHRSYWDVHCPICKSTGQATSNFLKRGGTCCNCSPFKARQGYVNIIYDNDTPIALKFGVSVDARIRTREQNISSSYRVECLGVWEFPDKQLCLKAERECMQEFETGVIPKHDFPDGYTETTYLYNLDKIIEIYNSNEGSKLF